MNYIVRLTAKAKQDLRNIYEYVAFTLLEPGIAKNLTNRIADGLKSLNQMPQRYTLIRKNRGKAENYEG